MKTSVPSHGMRARGLRSASVVPLALLLALATVATPGGDEGGGGTGGSGARPELHLAWRVPLEGAGPGGLYRLTATEIAEDDAAFDPAHSILEGARAWF